MKHTLRLIEGNNTARAAHPVDNRIRDFLAGDNDGSELFAALYGHIGREPIPERLRLPIGSNARFTVFLRGRVRCIRFTLTRHQHIDDDKVVGIGFELTLRGRAVSSPGF